MLAPIRIIFIAIILTLLGTYSHAASTAASLWSERSNSTTPLAQVPDFSALAERTIPAVVSISVQQKEKVANLRQGGDPLDYFHHFFRSFPGMRNPGMKQQPRGHAPAPRQRIRRGIGTGFVIEARGLILTNNHVVENADNIEVTFANKDGTERTMTATVLGTAPEYDVALLKTVERANAKITYLGSSNDMKIGDWVMAVGNPFGLSHSVSVGIISAKERRDIAPSGRRGLYNFLQTDASINPGNSGGPLINMRGEVIGINSAINAAGSGIGFAIPIDMVKEMLPQLESKGRYSRSWIGIRIQHMTPELAESYGLEKATGALVAQVVEGGPAADAGIEDGDLILEFDGKPVHNHSDLPLYASLAGVGKPVKLRLLRNGNEQTVTVTLAEFPNETAGQEGNQNVDTNMLGMTASNVTNELRQKMQLETKQGVVLTEVNPISPAGQAGLQAGDIILSVNGELIENARQFANLVEKVPAGKLLRIQLARPGSRLYVAFRKP